LYFGYAAVAVTGGAALMFTEFKQEDCPWFSYNK
jgi:hypothetical protein